MQVVAEEADVHAVALVQQLAAVGAAVAVVVAELPEPGDAGVPDVPLAGQHAGADAGGRVVEAVGEDGRRIGAAVAVAVDDPSHALVLDVEYRANSCPRYFGTSPRDRRPSGWPGRRRASSCARGFGHPGAEAERLGDVGDPFLVEAERHGLASSGSAANSSTFSPAGTRNVRIAFRP